MTGVQTCALPIYAEYAALAAKLAADKTYNQAMRQKIIAYREQLFNDLVPVKALEKFLIEKSQAARAHAQ